MIMPNLLKAEEKTVVHFAIFYDCAAKTFGIRQTVEETGPGVYLGTEKSMIIPLEDLKRLVRDAGDFIAAYGPDAGY
jgi:hypothetical protein